MWNLTTDARFTLANIVDSRITRTTRTCIYLQERRLTQQQCMRYVHANTTSCYSEYIIMLLKITTQVMRGV